MIHQIKEANYEGYIWMSDQNIPIMLSPDKAESFTFTDGDNPFCVEGFLWNAKEGISTSIRYADGHYYIATYEVKPEELANTSTTTSVNYIPHRLSGVKALKFVRKWEEDVDELCENMPTLRLKATVFVGFEK